MIDDTQIQEQENVVENQTEDTESEAEISRPPEESPQEKNFRALRDKAKRLERENEELKAYYAQQQTQPDDQDDDLGIDANEIAEGKHVKKVNKKVKQLEEQLKYYQQKTLETQIENQLKKRFSDFDNVVTKDNVETLRELDPDIAKSITSSNDLYSSAVLAYTMIKQLGIHKENNYDPDRERALKNNAKPRPLASVSPQQGESPLSQANAFAQGLTKELQEKLWKEMQEAKKNI